MPQPPLRHRLILFERLRFDIVDVKLDTEKISFRCGRDDIASMNAKLDTEKNSTPLRKNDTEHITRDASSGPEVGTLDEVDLFPPLLADIFVVGHKVKIAQSLTVGQDKLPMKVGTEGRILRQHETEPGLLWIQFGKDTGNENMVSIRTTLLDTCNI